MILNYVIGSRSRIAKFAFVLALCVHAFALDIAGLWQTDLPDGTQIRLHFTQASGGNLTGYMLFPGKKCDLNGTIDNESRVVAFSVKSCVSDSGVPTDEAHVFRGDIEDTKLSIQESIQNSWTPFHDFYRPPA